MQPPPVERRVIVSPWRRLLTIPLLAHIAIVLPFLDRLLLLWNVVMTIVTIIMMTQLPVALTVLPFLGGRHFLHLSPLRPRRRRRRCLLRYYNLLTRLLFLEVLRRQCKVRVWHLGQELKTCNPCTNSNCPLTRLWPVLPIQRIDHLFKRDWTRLKRFLQGFIVNENNQYSNDIQYAREELPSYTMCSWTRKLVMTLLIDNKKTGKSQKQYGY